MDSSTSTRQSNFFYRWLSMCCYKTPPQRTMSMSEENKAKWKEFGYRSTGSTLPPIFALLIDLYDGKDVLDGLESCRINPDLLPNHHIRNDLEYYIPQLTNFMVYHEDFLCQKLIMFLEGASRADPYFAHCYYWYINSLVTHMDQTKTQNILSFLIQECSTEPQAQLFLPFYQRFRLGLQRKLKNVDYEAKIKEMNERSAKAALVIQSYKADDLNLNMPDFQIKASDLELKLYQTTYVKEENVFPPNPFTSTLLFLEDLYCIAESITKQDDKLSYLKTLLHDVNKALPACVYIPFVKDSIRYYSILNIVVEESKVFSTKERAPFYLCMEIFRPQEELAYEYNDLFHLEDAEEVLKKKEKKKKSKKILDWAKKTFNLKTKHRSEEEDEERNPKRNTLFLQREPDEQFKLSKLTENISSPMTVKRVFRSQEGPELLGPRPKAASTQSLILHSHHENFTEFMVQTEETKEYKTPEKSELYTIPHQLGRMRKRTSDRNDLENDADSTGNGIAAIYQDDESQSSSIISSSNSKGSFLRKSFKDSITPQKPEGKTISETLQEPLIEDRKEDEDSDGGSDKERRIPSLVLSQEESLDFFGEDTSEEAERIKRDSPFRFLKSWKLVHLIVKSGADMKEEQFAVQLISQFDQIFKLEKTKLILTPYEIVSLGSDFGIVEMVKDILTMSRLKEKMKKHNIFSLNEFFVKFYGAEVDKARKRFCRSLAAYSVVCYFLQIKDRHNGNILFHKLGHILHIDFGFFLTNAPGKGLEFEKKVHFKLLNEHVEVLGGPRSRLFQYFRKLFYRGFMAARKHKEQILILVKMMYSTQGSNLPCFKGGIRAITELEQRFEPQGVEEGDLTGYCYNLINQSLDNWRAKCYDKYQYHFQGIFY